MDTVMATLLSIFFFGVCCAVCGILALWPEIKPTSPALEGRSLNYWTTREDPPSSVYYLLHFISHVRLPNSQPVSPHCPVFSLFLPSLSSLIKDLFYAFSSSRLCRKLELWMRAFRTLLNCCMLFSSWKCSVSLRKKKKPTKRKYTLWFYCFAYSEITRVKLLPLF